MNRRRPVEVDLAQGLAYAFLAAPGWNQRMLEAAGRQTLGRWYAWLRPLVGAVRETYRDAPGDRPYALVRFIAGQDAFVDGLAGADEADRPLRPVQLTPVPTTMGPSRWPIPPVADLAALGELLHVMPEHLTWLVDARRLQPRTPEGPMHVYRYRWLGRSPAVPRLLEAPTPILRGTLRRLLHEVLDLVPAHRPRTDLCPAAALSPTRPAMSGPTS